MSKDAKKHFGQHFLSNPGVISKIVTSIEKLRSNNELVLEIGPGKGALTAALLKKGINVVAYEIDTDMVTYLQKTLSEYISSEQLVVIKGDFMDSSSEEINEITKGQKFIAAGNLPYNVGSQITFKILEEIDAAQAGCFMLQKEVVQKFISSKNDKKNYGPPAIKMSWLADVHDFFWVSPGSFSPPPKVQSGVFSFSKKKNPSGFHWPLSTDSSYKIASELIHKAFQQRRKKLKNTIKTGLAEKYCALRPEELTPEDYLDIAKLQKDR